MEEFKSYLESELKPFDFNISTNLTRIAHHNGGDENPIIDQKYSIPISISTGQGKLVAELFECEDEQEVYRTILNVQASDNWPALLYFKTKSQWLVYCLYQNKDNSKVIVRTNAYGRKSFNIRFDTDERTSVGQGMHDTTIEEIVKEIKIFVTSGPEALFKNSLLAAVQRWFTGKNAIKENELKERVMTFLETLSESSFSIGELKFSLKPEWENRLFQAILGKVSEDKVIRFTSLNSLWRIMQSQTHTMLSIVCMNDKTECYYASQYLNNGQDDFLSHEANENFNNYITSLSVCGEYDLTMWRLYGDNTHGIAIEYSFDKTLPDNFYLAPVSYADTDNPKRHTALDFVNFLTTEEIKAFHHKFALKQWSVWQHFFKSADYSIEKEVRLLYCPEIIPAYKDWILTSGSNIFTPMVKFPLDEKNAQLPVFPLKISKIILGPNCPEQEVNKAMLKSLLSDMDKKIEVEVIEQSLYRP